MLIYFALGNEAAAYGDDGDEWQISYQQQSNTLLSCTIDEFI